MAATIVSASSTKKGGFLSRLRRRKPVVPVLRLNGVIMAGGGPLRRGLSAERMAPLIERAFETKGAVAVALFVNSPGGSPAQSSRIGQLIRQHAMENELPVIAFVEDAAASGGYWLACAADEIFADASSIVGSIGVISAGFGLQEAIAKIGVERRVHTAGTRKHMLDPFRPEDPEDVAHLEALQREIHKKFIAWVKERRGSKLRGTPEELFSGAFWTGIRAAELGLVDSLGEARQILRERYGKRLRMVPVEAKRGFLSSLFGGGGASARLEIERLPEAGLAALEERLTWQRIGL